MQLKRIPSLLNLCLRVLLCLPLAALFLLIAPLVAAERSSDVRS
jgi:hypothetical protein